MKSRFTYLAFSLTTLFLTACSAQRYATWSAENALTSTTMVPVTESVEYATLQQALKNSIAYYSKNPQQQIRFGTETIIQGKIIDSFHRLISFLSSDPTPTTLTEYLGEHFKIYRSNAPEVLYTGYYVPRLHGSLKKTDRFRYPLYKTPSDLVTVNLETSLKSKLSDSTPVINRGRIDKNTVHIPYYSRQEIEQGKALAHKDLELLWVDDPIELFFLHIQGSGTIELPDHTTLTVGFAEKNGWPYVAIGKTLLEKGYVNKGEITMMTIKDALRRHPEIVDEVLFSNPSYCFFRKLNGPPIGSLNVPVTANYSIATDSSIFPKGALALTEIDGKVTIALNQDTGGAIRGAGRVDIFYGDKDDAATKAGGMQKKGMLYFLAPR